MLRRVVRRKFTDVSEVLAASIIRVMSKSRALMMEAASGETSVNFHLTTLLNIPEDSFLQDLKSSNCSPLLHSCSKALQLVI
jgi:hypothetical protein